MKSRLVGAGINAYLEGRRANYAFHTVGRWLPGAKRRVDFYYRADDPYSHLLAQVLPRLASAYSLTIEVIPVDHASAASNPEPEMLAQHAMRDAALLAERYGLRFPTAAASPTEDRLRRAHAVLLQDRPHEEQLQVAIEVGDAIWSDDGAALASIVERVGAVSVESVRPSLEHNYVKLERAGHYQSGMLRYGGEWYWGIDRLHYLERRLQDEGLDGDIELTSGPVPSLSSLLHVLGSRPPRLQAFFSFRSPYSYLSLPQLQSMRDEGVIDLVLRPVLPMVMRGLPVPRAKRLYIVHDAKREADRLGVPFGHICDPLGKGIGHCLAVFFECTAGTGRELDFALSAMQGIWSEARDVATLPDLIAVAERAGIGEAEVRAALADESWKERAAANREALTSLGLWGVPSVHIGSYSTWGQDRLPLIRAALEATSADM